MTIDPDAMTMVMTRDRTILEGNCIIIDVDFWNQPIVQRFLELVLGSGAHIRFRYNGMVAVRSAAAEGSMICCCHPGQ